VERKAAADLGFLAVVLGPAADLGFPAVVLGPAMVLGLVVLGLYLGRTSVPCPDILHQAVVHIHVHRSHLVRMYSTSSARLGLAQLEAVRPLQAPVAIAERSAWLSPDFPS
jgi:hypothetical protein